MGLNRIARQGAVVGALVVVGSAWSGCAEKKATEFVAGISSQVQVPRDLQTVVITVSVNGVLAFNNNYPVYDGKVELPKTLGVQQASTPPGTPVNISVLGFDVPQSAQLPAFTDQSSIPTVGSAETAANPNVNGGARVLRSTTQPYEQGQIIYVPMPLHYSCYDVDCGQAAPAGTIANCGAGNGATAGPCTCKAGVCVDPTTDPTTLRLHGHERERREAAWLHGLRDHAAHGRRDQLHLRAA
jgi:hypothetical protein